MPDIGLLTYPAAEAPEAERPAFGALELQEAAWLAAIGYVVFSFYEVVGRAAALRGFDLGPALRTPLDARVPYLPLFVLPYALAYVAPLWAAAEVAKLGGMAAFRRAFFAYVGLVALHFAFYLAWPTSARAVMLPEAALGSGALAWGVRFFYRVAPPWNAFPSFHVAGGWFFYRVLARWNPRAARPFALWFWLMAFSTAAIKIHWVLDGSAGLLAAEAWDRWVLTRLERRGACAWTWSGPRPMAAVHAGVFVVLGAALLASLRALGSL